MSLQKQNIFSNAPQQRKQLSAQKEKQLAYLKEHDNEIKEFVKSQTQRSNLFQIDWDQTRWEDIGMVHPKGRKSCEYFGGFNYLKTSKDWNVLPIEIKNGKIDMEKHGDQQ